MIKQNDDDDDDISNALRKRLFIAIVCWCTHWPKIQTTIIIMSNLVWVFSQIEFLSFLNLDKCSPSEIYNNVKKTIWNFIPVLANTKTL